MFKRRPLLWLALLSCLLTIGAEAQQATPRVSANESTTPVPSQTEIRTRQGTRLSAVKEAAMSVAMRTALADESERINNTIVDSARMLDEVYDFGSLMLQGNIIPPIIQRADAVTETSQDDILQYTGRIFRIKTQPRFATRAPSWRSYLIQPVFTDIAKPHPALLPQNDEERAAWVQGIAAGWDAGASQAHAIYVRGAYRLQADLLGMMTYHWLLRSNMVTQPIVTNQSKALIGDATTLAIDQITYRIEAKPVFNGNMNEWIPYLNAPDPSMADKQIMEAATRRVSLNSIRSVRPSRQSLMQAAFDK